MRLIVARCDVDYTGRLTARLPEALRLLMVKADGSVLVHADAGGYKPLNWMTPPTVIEEEDGLIVVRKLKGEDRLEIRLAEVISDSTHDMEHDPGLEKDGVEAHLQEALAAAPGWCGEGFRLVRREWPTDIGPVDLMCRDDDDGWIAVEIKRIGHDRRRRAAHALPRADPARPGARRVPRRARRAGGQAAGARAGGGARDRLGRGRPRRAAGRARARAHAVRRSGGIKPSGGVPRDMTLDPPRVVGRYEIVRQLGRGGMATVHLARQPALDREVALKELHPAHAADAAFARRFLHESRVGGALNHPSVVSVIEYFEHDGAPFIAMEYLERGSLRPHVGPARLPRSRACWRACSAGSPRRRRWRSCTATSSPRTCW